MFFKITRGIPYHLTGTAIVTTGNFIFDGSSQKSVKTLIPAQSDELHCWSQNKAHGHRRPL